MYFHYERAKAFPLRFVGRIKLSVRNYLSGLSKQHSNISVFVGVHVRRTDIKYMARVNTGFRWNRNGEHFYKPANFFFGAMNAMSKLIGVQRKSKEISFPTEKNIIGQIYTFLQQIDYEA